VNSVRGVSQRTFSDQGQPGSEVEKRYAPRSSTPQAKSFSERSRVKLAAKVVQVGATEPLYEDFSPGLFVGLRILAESPILRSMLE
jgi:hypothetical protein